MDGSDQFVVRQNPTSTPTALKLIAVPGGLRDNYAADYYDAAGRLTAEENVGTSGGAVWTRPAAPDAADASHLVTLFGYDAAGNQNSVTDPLGIVSTSSFDMLGQPVQTIADESDPAGNPIQQTTAYTFDGDGHVLTMTAVMPGGTPSQTTQYIYGVGTNVGTDLFSNDLLARIEYPDLSTGAASSDPSNDVSYTYDNLGETASKTDQNGTPHLYSYDSLGRLTLDVLHSLGGNADSSVWALGYSYNRQGLPFQQTSYSMDPTLGCGAPFVNQDQDQYNGFGQLTAEYQSASGPVDTSSTPEVQYGYSSALLGSRLTSMTYPNGRVIYYGYDGNALDNALGRVDYLADSDGTHLADYTYLGLNAIVGQADGDGVTETTTLDNFGRIAEMNYADAASNTSTDDFAYGYDADGNVLYKSNGVNANFSELYAYDSLNRLTTFNRGTLAAGNNAIATANPLPGASQSWALDAIGNQTAVTTDTATTTKTQNSQNELTGMGGATLSYDNNGNMTADQNGNTYIGSSGGSVANG